MSNFATGRSPAGVVRQDFQALGGYYEPGETEVDHLSATIAADDPPADGWRFFGTRLLVRISEERSIIWSHGLLRDEAVRVFDLIRNAGFGPSQT